MRNQLLMVEDYAYEGADFYHDPKLVLPDQEVWDDQGKKKTLSIFLLIFFLFHFLFCSTKISDNVFMQTLDLSIQLGCCLLLGEQVPRI